MGSLRGKGQDFARAEPGLDFVDLQTFGSNAPAIALYESLGFETFGVRRDAFRIDGLLSRAARG